MTTLLPILLALGMHPQLTPSCFLQDHPPGVPCHDTSRDEHSSTSFEPLDDHGTIATPAPEKAAAPDPSASLIFLGNGTSYPKPKRKAKPVTETVPVWTECDPPGMCRSANDPRAFYDDKSTEGVGDSKQPAPGLMPVLTAIREDDLAYTVIILIGLGLLAWFVLRIGADIINSILGTGRK